MRIKREMYVKIRRAILPSYQIPVKIITPQRCEDCSGIMVRMVFNSSIYKTPYHHPGCIVCGKGRRGNFEREEGVEYDSKNVAVYSICG